MRRSRGSCASSAGREAILLVLSAPNHSPIHPSIHHNSSRIAAVTTPKKALALGAGATATDRHLLAEAALKGGGEGQGEEPAEAAPSNTTGIPCVNLFDVRQEFSDVQEVRPVGRACLGRRREVVCACVGGLTSCTYLTGTQMTPNNTRLRYS